MKIIEIVRGAIERLMDQPGFPGYFEKRELFKEIKSLLRGHFPVDDIKLYRAIERGLKEVAISKRTTSGWVWIPKEVATNRPDWIIESGNDSEQWGKQIHAGTIVAKDRKDRIEAYVRGGLNYFQAEAKVKAEDNADRS